MAINKRRDRSVKIGGSVKSVAISLINTVEESAGIIEDTAVTARSMVEMVHGALQEPIAEQRIDYALTVQSGLALLKEKGMTEEEARKYLQCEDIRVTTSEEDKAKKFPGSNESTQG